MSSACMSPYETLTSSLWGSAGAAWQANLGSCTKSRMMSAWSRTGFKSGGQPGQAGSCEHPVGVVTCNSVMQGMLDLMR